MRILFWSPLFWPHIGGTEVLGAQLVGALHERGHEITVLTRRDPRELAPEDELGGVRIMRHPFGEALERRDIDAVVAARRAVAQIKREFRPDVIHVSGPSADVIFHRLTAHGEPTLVSLHSVLSLDLEARDGLLGRALQDADWLVGCSAWMLESLRQRLPVARSFSSVIHNALPTPVLAPSPASFEPPRVLMVGRLTPSKGFDLGLQAVAGVRAEHPGLRLTIAGDGPQRGELERQAHTLGLGEVAEFLGWVDPEQIPTLISASSVVVMPSRSEPFGLVALQAAQMQRALVGFAVGGLPEVVSHGVTGLLARPEDVRELVGYLGRLLADPRAADALGAAALCRVRHRSWQNYVEAHETLYERLARPRSSE